MKRITIILLSIILFSCSKKEEKNYSVINGTIENSSAEKIIIQGNDFTSETPVAPDGKFSDTLYIKTDGFYQLIVGREHTDIYLERGKNLSVDVNLQNFDETVKYSGDLAKENNYLAAKYLWNSKNLDYKDLYSADEKGFRTNLTKREKQLDSLYFTYDIKNENFQNMIGKEDSYNQATLYEDYQDAHRYFTGVEDYQVSDTFYDNLKNIDYKDTLAYRNYLSYQNMMDAHFNRLINNETYQTGDNDHTLLFLTMVNDSLPNGYAKDKMMTNFLQFQLKPDKNLDEAYNIYKSTDPNPENLAKLTERYNMLKTITEGQPSPTFNFENHKGGTTSLESLKGTYVYIDVWATWCGPCLREIPALKETEKEYHGKNIEFVSISIDEAKDYDKWKTMVNEKSLGGIQLMADNNWKSEFVQQYGIMGIPRFILIDPKGDIVAGDAPRPSDPQLKIMLDELL